MHGLGNDFVILDGREEAVAMTPALARAIADRRTGVGCDQLIVLEPSSFADLRMDIWNADGGMAEACGNASRCVVKLTGAATIETAGGIIEGAADGDEVEVSLGEPRFEWDAIPLAYPMNTAPVPLAWDEFAEPMAVNVGNPHVVFFVDAIDEARLAEVGPRIEHDAIFPERINVNVASIDGWRRDAAHVGARRRADAGVRHRGLRDGGGGDRQQARDLAGAGRDEGRFAEHRLGAGRAGADARRRDLCVRGADRPRYENNLVGTFE